MTRREPPKPPAPTENWNAAADAAAANQGRVPPHDLDAEAAVLSAVLIDPAAFDKVSELKAEWFYSERHRRIFEAVIELHAVGQAVDIVTVGSWLKSRERLGQVGGMGYLTEVLNAAPAVANVGAYGDTIADKYGARQIILTAQRVAATGYGDYGGLKAFAEETEQAFYALARVDAKNAVVRIREPLMVAIRKVQEAAARGAQITGVPSGFRRFDSYTAGFHDGDLTILAARPGMGKTALVLNIAVNIASPPLEGDCEYGVIMFSLEMPREQLALRAACSEGRVDLSKMRTGMLSRGDWDGISQAANLLGAMPLFLDDSPSLTILDMRAKVRRIQAEFDTVGPDGRRTRRIGAVIVDYLQLMKGRDGAQSREQEISEISRGLKGLAKELHVPVIALSQLNRAVETRSEKNKRPQISDLRESGAIEQDADNICFVYRDDYYNRGESEEPNIAELIIAKQRNGPTGTVKVRFDHQYTRFDNLADGEYADTGDGES